MTHASVFSGIGGPEVAAAMLGWENLFHCEINPFGRAVLQYWFPNATSYEDITTTDFSEWGGKVNVLTGGFPCQPFSYAGQRRGADDDRYLWPFMHRCINQVRPDWVVCENVGGILTMVEQGDVTQVAAEKSLFDEGDTLYRYRLEATFTLERICQDLERDGYAVQAVIIPACAVNAPHRRDRVFIIGHRNDIPDPIRKGWEGQDQPRCGQGGQRVHLRRDPARCHRQDDAGRATTTHTDCRGEGTPRKGGCVESDRSDQDKLTEQRRAETKRDDRLHAVLRPVTDPTGNGGDRIATGESGQAARQDGQLDAEPAINGGVLPRTSAHPNCNRGGEMDEHLQPRLADGSKPVGNGRERIVADTESQQGGRLRPEQPECGEPQQGELGGGNQKIGRGGYAPHTRCTGLEEFQQLTSDMGKKDSGRQTGGYCDGGLQDREFRYWADFPTQSPVHRGNDGIPFPLDNLTISPSKWRTESLKAYGNAIVPQVMYEIFKAIEATYD